MKIGRRSKRSFFKTSIMGRMLGDLVHRGRREQAKHAGAQAARKLRRPAFSLEPVEPRLLMSADISYTPSGVTNTLNVSASFASGNYFLDITGNVAPPVHQQLSAAGDVNINITPLGGTIAGAGLADTIHFNLDTFSALNNFVTGNGGLLTLDYAGGLEALQDDHIFVDGSAANVGYSLKLHTSADITVGATATFTGDLTLSSDDSITGNASTHLSAQNLTLQSAPVTNGGAVPSTGILANANSTITLTDSHLTASKTLTLDSHAKVTVDNDGKAVSGVTGAVITSFSNAKIDIGGTAVLQAKDVSITSFVEDSLKASADKNTVKLLAVVGGAAPEVTINGTAQLTATNNLTATAKSDVTTPSVPMSR